MPDFITQSVLGQFERFVGGESEKNVLVASLEERAGKLKDVSAEDRAEFVAAAGSIVAKSVIPAFQRAQALLQEQLPLTKSDAGLWRLPGGDRAYANALRRFTTTEFTPEQIHEIGLKEVARIEQEMDGLFRQLGYTEGGIKERFEKLDLASQPPAEPDPRPALLAQYTEILRDAEKRAALVFDLRPKAPIEVLREPRFTEKTATATAQGIYLGQTGSLDLTVKNVNLDNFGSYAGDGLDDAWQNQYFGLDNPLAAPAADPDGDGQTNAFEFTVGLIPNNPASRFTLNIEPVAGQPTQRKLTFRPLVAGRSYTVTSKPSLAAGSYTNSPL